MGGLQNHCTAFVLYGRGNQSSPICDAPPGTPFGRSICVAGDCPTCANNVCKVSYSYRTNGIKKIKECQSFFGGSGGCKSSLNFGQVRHLSHTVHPQSWHSSSLSSSTAKAVIQFPCHIQRYATNADAPASIPYKEPMPARPPEHITRAGRWP